MRIIELKSKQHAITLFDKGIQSSFTDLAPMEMIVAAIAKDILEEIKSKVALMDIELKDFSVKVILRKNEEKNKSKIIESHLSFPDNLPTEIINKLQKVADKSHVKRMLGNEIVFAPSSPKE